MSQYTKGRGYDIRTRQVGEILPSGYQHAWAPAGQLPPEWEETKNNLDVVEAQIYYSTQRSKRADHRQIIDSFSRQGEGDK